MPPVYASYPGSQSIPLCMSLTEPRQHSFFRRVASRGRDKRKPGSVPTEESSTCRDRPGGMRIQFFSSAPRKRGVMDWQERMTAAIDYIERNLYNEVDLEKAAAAVNCSVFHFYRMFEVITGIGPGEYLRRRRLSEAARLIELIRPGTPSPRAARSVWASLGRAGIPPLRTFSRAPFGFPPTTGS